MADDGPQHDFFDFFGLAPELRNLIYDETFELDKRFRLDEGDDDDNLQAIVEDFPAPNLLLVNHQFRQEYLARSRTSTTLVVEDRIGFVTFKPRPSLPCMLMTTERLHLKLYMGQGPRHCMCTDSSPQTSCIVRAEFEMHAHWKSRLVEQLPRLRSCLPDMHCPSSPGLRQAKHAFSAHALELTTILERVNGVRILSVRRMHVESCDYSLRIGPVAQWAKKNRFLEEVEVSNLTATQKT